MFHLHEESKIVQLIETENEYHAIYQKVGTVENRELLLSGCKVSAILHQ
jgi:hypothetical protein